LTHAPPLRPVHCRLEQGHSQSWSAAESYEDDCQVCVTTSVDDAALAVDRPAGCVADVGAWTSSSRLRLNSSKTQVMWLGHKNQIDKIKINIRSVPVLSSTVSIADSARDLGAVIDSRLTMSDQVTVLHRASYYQQRQLRPVARSLPEESAKTL